MKQCYLQTPGGIFELWSNDDFVFGKREQLLLSAYVPGATVLEEPIGRVTERIRHTGDDSVWLVLYGVLRRILIQQELYSVHAACVGRDGRYTLIVGHSGAGKSTIAEALVSEHDRKLFSGNKTIIDIKEYGMSAVAGTKTMTRSFREKRPVPSDTLRYWDRMAYRLPEDSYASSGVVPISAIVMVRLNDYDQVFERLAEESALHRLYPFFLDVMGADVLLADDLLDGTVSKKARERLVCKLRSALRTIPVYQAAGSLECITTNIIQL